MSLINWSKVCCEDEMSCNLILYENLIHSFHVYVVLKQEILSSEE